MCAPRAPGAVGARKDGGWRPCPRGPPGRRPCAASLTRGRPQSRLLGTQWREPRCRHIGARNGSASVARVRLLPGGSRSVPPTLPRASPRPTVGWPHRSPCSPGAWSGASLLDKPSYVRPQFPARLPADRPSESWGAVQLPCPPEAPDTLYHGETLRHARRVCIWQIRNPNLTSCLCLVYKTVTAFVETFLHGDQGPFYHTKSCDNGHLRFMA